jgi:hypothetical protein
MRWLYSCFAGLTLLCGSCIDQSDYEIDSVSLEPTYVGKLVTGSLGITDLLNDDDSLHFKTNNEGLLYVTYDQELVSQDIRNLFDIPSIPINRSFVMPGATIPPHNKDLRSDSIASVVDFGMSPEKLDEISLSEGRITYSTSNNPSSTNLDYEVQIALAGFKSRTTGKSLSAVIKGNGTIDLSDYDLTLNDNKFDLKLVLVLKKTSSFTVIPPASSVNIQLNFGGFKFFYIKGFLGDQVTSLDAQSMPVGIFDSKVFQEADISLAQPKVSLTVYNQNGVPCNVTFTKLEARKDGAAPMQITLNPANPVPLAYPTVIGDTKATTVTITNVNELLNYAPNELYYQADARINEGLTSGENFVLDTSEMKVKLNIEIPLWGTASGIVLQDTLDVDLENVEGSEVDAVQLKLKFVNEFPLDGNVQFVLTDNNYTPITTLLTSDQTNIIKGSTVNAAGELQSAGVYDGIIDLDKSKIDNMFDAKHIIVVTSLQTSRNAAGGAQDVKFMADYKLSIDVGVLATLKLKVE